MSFYKFKKREFKYFGDFPGVEFQFFPVSIPKTHKNFYILLSDCLEMTDATNKFHFITGDAEFLLKFPISSGYGEFILTDMTAGKSYLITPGITFIIRLQNSKKIR